MITTDVDTFTPEQRAVNEAACEHLLPGAIYRFHPPVKASAIPTGGYGVCEAQLMDFELGHYIGFIKGLHAFLGRPINDSRRIIVPSSFQNVPNQDEKIAQLRDSYFHVAFIDGQSLPTLIKRDP